MLEPAQLVVAGQQAGLDHLERHGPVERDLPGLVDDAHAAAAQLAADLVIAEVAHGGAGRQDFADAPPAAGPVVRGRGLAVVRHRGRGVVGRPLAVGRMPAGFGRPRVGPPGRLERPGGRVGIRRGSGLGGCDRRLGRAEGGRHRVGVGGESVAIFDRGRALAASSPPVDLDLDQVAEQGRPHRLRDPLEVVLDPGPLPFPPFRLEPVAGPIQLLGLRRRQRAGTLRPSQALAPIGAHHTPSYTRRSRITSSGRTPQSGLRPDRRPSGR